jgi:TPR repeat protein
MFYLIWTGKSHSGSCYNLAVLYKNGDTGVEKDELKFEEIKKLTQAIVAKEGKIKGLGLVNK